MQNLKNLFYKAEEKKEEEEISSSDMEEDDNKFPIEESLHLNPV